MITIERINSDIINHINCAGFPTGNVFTINYSEPFNQDVLNWLNLWDKIDNNIYNILGNTFEFGEIE